MKVHYEWGGSPICRSHMKARFDPLSPQPPKRYTQEFIEPGWLWSKSTSGEGNEQQDLWTLPAKPSAEAVIIQDVNGMWGWQIGLTHKEELTTCKNCTKVLLAMPVEGT